MHVHSFRLLWIASVALPLLAFIGSALVAYTTVMATTVMADARSRASRFADTLHDQANRAFETAEALMVTTDFWVAGWSWEEIAQSEQLHRLLAAMDEATPISGGLGLVAPDGFLVAGSRTPAGETRRYFGDRDYVLAHSASGAPAITNARGTFVGSTRPAISSDGLILPLSRARTDAQGRPDGGVIVATILPARLADLYRELVENPGDVAALWRLDGALLARFPPAGSAPPARAASGEAMAEEAISAASRAPDIFGVGIAGDGIVVLTSQLDGWRRLVAFRRLSGYPASVGFGVQYSAILRAWALQLVAPGAGAVAAMALLLFLTAREQAAARARLDAEAARAAAEAQVQHLQRVGALGELVAGAAHDFGNAAQTIISGAQLIARAAADNPVVTRYAEAIGDTAQSAGGLTRRLLAFARGASQDAANQAFDVTDAIEAACGLLGRTLGSGYRLERSVAGALPPLAGDPSGFEAALVNLVVNARDAMPAGGTVTVAASLAPKLPPGLTEGTFVAVSVKDDGVGMDAATLARAGEAFFTTKQEGRGTGLGLAGVRAFAERSGGTMTIESAPGAGTVVTLWLVPAAAVDPAPTETGASKVSSFKSS